MLFTRTLLSLLAFATLPSRRHNVVHAQGIDDVIRWVVTFNEGVLPDQVVNVLTLAGIDVPEIPLQIPELFMSVFMMSPTIAKKIMNLSVVKYVERDVEVKIIDPVSENPADISSTARQGGTEQTPYGIDMVQALEVPDDNVGALTVCVIDSGYAIGHADLPGSEVVTGSDEIGVQPWFEDDNGHGTHVTGIIAALGGNGFGVQGVNRNGQLNLHILRIFDASGQTFSSDTMANIQDCVNAGANVVSMSFGRSDQQTAEFGLSGPLEFEKEAFDKYYNQGVLFVAAAGNDGTSHYNWPASYDSVMSVAAIDENREVASFSQRNDQVDLAAPGVEVLSTIPNNEFAFFSGTSQACPHVSGVAALVWSRFPDKSAQEIRQALTASAQDLGPEGLDESYGYGLVQAAAAVDYLTSGGSAPAPSPSPSPPATEECTDDPSWTDPWGDDCGFYSAGFLCQAFGPFTANSGGQTAIDACCSCGGGVRIQSVESLSASERFTSPRALSFLACFTAAVVSVLF
jgi:subtilisin family serine protease